MGMMLSPLPSYESVSVASLQKALAEKMKQLTEAEKTIADLREQLRLSQETIYKDSTAVSEVRRVLGPLYSSLQYLFGQMDTAGVGAEASKPANAQVWEQWKQKLGANSLAARAIDALILNKELNHTQLRIQLGCATGSVTNVVVTLNKAGLITKSGGKISLRQL